MSYAGTEMEQRAEQSLVSLDVDSETLKLYQAIRAGTASVTDLQRILDRDPLINNVLNIRGFERRLERYLKVGVRGVLIAVDVDEFKRFNDSQGHPAGDSLLKISARVLHEQTRTHEPTQTQLEQRSQRNTEKDLLGRAGGDEFLVFLVGATLPDAMQAAKRIRRNMVTAVRQYFPEYGPEQTMSLGLSEVRPDDTIKTIRQRADQALYKAKARKPPM